MKVPWDDLWKLDQLKVLHEVAGSSRLRFWLAPQWRNLLHGQAVAALQSAR
jgi:hypothetical protein